MGHGLARERNGIAVTGVSDRVAHEIHQRLIKQVGVSLDPQPAGSVERDDSVAQCACSRGRLLEEGADLGIAWDGDADRCFFIDDRGAFVDGDFLTAILAEHLLDKDPGSTILYDCRASRAVADVVTAAGGVAEINRVGHAFFKTRMKREGSLFGGEVSGHYYFRDFYCADSGTLPALLMLEKLSVEGLTLSELVGSYRATYFISGEINSTVTDAGARIAELEERYGGMPGANVTHVDGVSVDFDDWHFNVRSSNTEPLLRLCLESLVSVADMEAKRDEVLAIIRA